MSRIKEIINKIKMRMFYNRCYSANKDIGNAIFGNCEGFGENKTCNNCPYCEHDLTYISSEDEYCCRCGQKLNLEA